MFKELKSYVRTIYSRYQCKQLCKLIIRLEEPMTPLDWTSLRVKYSYQALPNFLPLQPPRTGAAAAAKAEPVGRCMGAGA